jgi:type IV pilus assembly protein PilE
MVATGSNRERGFTLVEMLIALAIIGILATVAYPSYQESVRKTRRSDGIAAALAVQVAQEKFRGSCPFYAQSLGATNTCGASAALSTVQADATSREGFYALSIAANSATGNAYTVVIDPTGAQAEDTTCDPMQIAYSAANPAGARTPAACW